MSALDTRHVASYLLLAHVAPQGEDQNFGRLEVRGTQWKGERRESLVL